MINLYRIIRAKADNTTRLIRHYYNFFTDYSPKLLILVYHNVLPKIKFDPFSSILSVNAFIKQLDILAQRYPIISLSEGIRQCKEGGLKDKIQIILTFDDGYSDNYEVVYPILKKKGIPATFFLVTDCIDNSRPLWYYELLYIIFENKKICRVKVGGTIIRHRITQPRLSFILSIIEQMKSLSHNGKEEILNTIREETKRNFSFNYDVGRCITWEQAREMSMHGIEIGAHGLYHSSLARIPFKDAMEEIRKSKEAIEKEINNNCLHFAFPFGNRQDYNQQLIDYVLNIEFQSCLLNIHGYNHFKKDNFCFKRTIMNERTNINYILG